MVGGGRRTRVPEAWMLSSARNVISRHCINNAGARQHSNLHNSTHVRDSATLTLFDDPHLSPDSGVARDIGLNTQMLSLFRILLFAGLLDPAGRV